MRRMLMLAAAAALAGLVGGTPEALAQKVIKYTHFQPGRADQPKHAAAEAFRKHVEEKSGGKLKVQIYPAGQLGNATSVLEGLRLGSIELAVVHDGGISSVYKPIDVFMMPYLFRDSQVAWAVWDGPFTKEFGEDMLKRTGIRLMAFADNGIRHFTNSKRPIKTPADLKGLKIRVQPSPVYIKLVESLGASTSAIDWGELPAALAQGTVDGQENGVTNILAASLYQHQKHATLDGHVYSLHAYLFSDAFWQTLTDQEKKIVAEGVDIAKDIHRRMTAEQDNAAKSILESKGMQVTTLTPAERDAFRDVAQPPVRAFLEQEFGKERVTRLVEAVEAAQRKTN
ncbi:MAG TPA: DctP family TRAP transporter solute-binding subunit [Azospirillum sp.]